MPRPRKHVDAAEIIKLRAEGMSFPAIARRVGLGQATVHRIYRASAPAPFQNPEKPFQNPASCVSHTEPADTTLRTNLEAPSAKIRETPGQRFLRELEAAARARRARLQQAQPKPVRPAPARIPRPEPRPADQQPQQEAAVR